MSEEKARRKDLCWFVGSVNNLESRLGCYKWYQSRPLQYGVVRGRTKRKLVGM